MKCKCSKWFSATQLIFTKTYALKCFLELSCWSQLVTLLKIAFLGGVTNYVIIEIETNKMLTTCDRYV